MIKLTVIMAYDLRNTRKIYLTVIKKLVKEERDIFVITRHFVAEIT